MHSLMFDYGSVFTNHSQEHLCLFLKDFVNLNGLAYQKLCCIQMLLNNKKKKKKENKTKKRS